MRRYYEFWLWIGGALVACALASVAIAGGLVSSKEKYDFWTSSPMIAAYSFAVAALFCFVAALRDFAFPLVVDSHAQAVRQQEQERKALDKAIAAMNNCITAGGLARVALYDDAKADEERINAYDAWFALCCDEIGRHAPGDLPSFRRSLSPLAYEYSGVKGPIRAPIATHITQLDMRQDMLVKIVERLQGQRSRT